MPGLDMECAEFDRQEGEQSGSLRNYSKIPCKVASNWYFPVQESVNSLKIGDQMYRLNYWSEED